MRLSFLFVSMLSCIMLSAQKVTPGLSVDDFKLQMPGVIPDHVTYNETLSLPEKIGRFDGKWYFEFNRDTLQTITYSYNMGSKPAAGSFSGYKFMYDYLNVDFKRPKLNIAPKDTVFKENRKRINNVDTVFFSSWQYKYARIVMGVYYTGNNPVKVDPSHRVSQNMINADASLDYYVFTIRVLPLADKNAPDAWKFYPGKSVYEFAKLRPEVFPNGIGVTGQFAKAESLMGMKGNWAFDFKSSILDWMLWNHYAGKYDKTTFMNCLRSTRGLIAEYSKQFGTAKIVTDNTAYRDPLKDHHYGYEVLKAVWDKGTYTIEIVFDFMGGKGMYDLLVKIEEHRK